MKRTVFISHSSQDKKIADAVCSFLEKHGVHCWIAPRDITPGKNYGAAIIDAISECEFFVLILSSLSNDSQQVVREVERAASTQSVVIPLRVEAVQPSKDLQFYVSSSHWLDAVTPPLDQHLTALLRAIEGWQKDEGQRRRRISQPAEDIAPRAPRDKPLPNVVSVRKRPGIWIAVLSVVTIAAICAVAVFLKRFSLTPPPRKEISTVTASTPGRDRPGEVLRRFPEDFLERLGGHDIEAILRYFAEPADYYEAGKVSHNVIRSDLERDDKTWPKRSYSLNGEPRITPVAGTNTFIVDFPMAYSFTNNHGTTNGLLQMTMRVRMEEGTVVILEVQKKVVHATSPRSNSESSRPVGTQIVAPTVVPSPTTAPGSTPAPQATPTAEASIIAPASLSPEQKADTPIIQNVTASSVLAPQTYRGEVRRYDAKLAFDHDETTAWVPTRNGINSWIEADFTSPVTITSVSIYGGYGVDARRYERNNRARSVRVAFSDGSSETLSLEDKMKLQRFELRHPVVTSSAKIEILAVYRGDQYDETPISEIAFNRD